MGIGERSRAERGESAFTGMGGRTPRVLAHGANSSRCLTSDARYLYWVENGAEVTRLPRDGGVPTVLATSPHAHSLLAADGALYWIAPGHRERLDALDGRVMRMPVDGGTPEILLRGLPTPESLAVDGRNLAIGCAGEWNWDVVLDQTHWESRGLVLRATVGDERVQTVATKQRGPESVLWVGDELYWANHGYKRSQYFADGSVMRAPRGGGRKRHVVRRDQSQAASLVADERHVYWTVGATVWSPVPHRPGGIMRRERDSARCESLVEWGHETGQIALDATHVYWLDSARANLYRVRKDGAGEPEPLVRCAEPIMLARGLVVDEHRVYWVVDDAPSAGGALWSVAKEPPGTRRAPPEPSTGRPN